jgi:hypothetical protein
MSEVAAGCVREDPEQRRLKLEERDVRKAVEESLLLQEKYDNERLFSSLQELLECLKKFKLSKFWDTVSNDDCIIFLNLEKNAGNFVLHYVSKELNLTVSCKGVKG